MIWPWSRFRHLEQSYLDMVKRHNDLSARHNTIVDLLADERIAFKEYTLISAHAAEIAAINLRTVERDLERAQTEAHSLKQDLRHLAASLAAKNSTKYGPIGDLNRDPFAEDPKIPDSWLTDDSTLPDLRAEELLDSGESENGLQRGSATDPGAEGAP